MPPPPHTQNDLCLESKGASCQSRLGRSKAKRFEGVPAILFLQEPPADRKAVVFFILAVRMSISLLGLSWAAPESGAPPASAGSIILA